MAKGTIKFFNSTKGFGFIEREGADDVFVHISAVQKSGFSAEQMLEGASVEFTVGEQKGRMGVEHISSLEGGSPSMRSQVKANKPKHSRRRDSDRSHQSPDRRREGSRPRDSGKPQLSIGAIAFGVLKFFNTDKGYGFLEVTSRQGVADVFLHVDDVPEGLCSGDPEEGDSFRFKVVEHRGKLKASVIERYDDSKPIVAGKYGKPPVTTKKPGTADFRPKANPLKPGMSRQGAMAVAAGLKTSG